MGGIGQLQSVDSSWEIRMSRSGWNRFLGGVIDGFVEFGEWMVGGWSSWTVVSAE